jgi:F0F1-type ATP synthase membrane subunit a
LAFFILFLAFGKRMDKQEQQQQQQQQQLAAAAAAAEIARPKYFLDHSVFSPLSFTLLFLIFTANHIVLPLGL